jgi:hypothetical protein
MKLTFDCQGENVRLLEDHWPLRVSFSSSFLDSAHSDHVRVSGNRISIHVDNGYAVYEVEGGWVGPECDIVTATLLGGMMHRG